MNDLTVFYRDSLGNKVAFNGRYLRKVELSVSSETLQLYRVIAHDYAGNQFHLTERVQKAKAEQVMSMLRTAIAARDVVLEIPDNLPCKT